MTDPTDQADADETFTLRVVHSADLDDCTLIPTAFAGNHALSLDARGVGAWFASFGEDFTATADEVAAAGPDPRDVIDDAIDELVTAGYLTPAGDGYRFAFKPEEIEAANQAQAAYVPKVWADDEGWGIAPGARYVGPDEYLRSAPELVRRTQSMVDRIFIQAFAAAADEQGWLRDFDVVKWYTKHVTDALRDEDDDDPGPALEYDQLTFCVYIDSFMRLHDAGLLAQRGKGDGEDLRLTLPADATSEAP